MLVVLGAMIGAPLRYLTDRAVQRRHDSAFPWGTLTVNVAGSFVLGALTGAALPDPVAALGGVGLCGALTTYSTFSYDTLRLVEERSYALAAASTALNVVGSVLAAAVGWTLLS